MIKYLGWYGTPIKNHRKALAKTEDGKLFIRLSNITREAVHTGFEEPTRTLTDVVLWEQVDNVTFKKYVDFLKQPSDTKFNIIMARIQK